MYSRSGGILAALLVVSALLLFSCSGGGGGIEDGPGPAFSLIISASPDTGKSPLAVTFQAVPSGGSAPYTYAWDFNGDGVTDTNASTGTSIFSDTAVATVTVTDSQDRVVTASKTITINGIDPGAGSDALDVRYSAAPIVGNVPFNVQFEAYVTGGKSPYAYSWDFEGDGIFDSFIANPLYTYTQIGAESGGQYSFFPVLRVEDNRGVVGSNFDDNDNNGNPDFKLSINAAPPAGGMNVAANGNPLTGQAPLTVEFTGSVNGGSGNYEFTWSFGDGTDTQATQTSVATHTYLQPGVYSAICDVHDTTTDERVTTFPLTITASVQQLLDITIEADVNTGQVPFIVNFEAMPVNGTEPITYEWDIFTDTTPLEAEPTIGTPPGLSGAAVVTPDYSQRKNPAIHFGNTAGTGAPYSYVARCVARDAAGNTKLSNLIRIVASPNTTYPFYESTRPLVIGKLTFPALEGGESANPVFEPFPIPLPWAPRANAATCAHSTGITYVFGGEILDENGNFERLVNVGNSAYVFVPARAGTGTNEGAIGKYAPGANGIVIRLNDVPGPAFPSSPKTGMSPQWPDPGGDSRVPPVQDPDESPAKAPPAGTQRSTAFEIVGSAAAVMVHEQPETNPAGAYPKMNVSPGMVFSIDRDICGMPPSRLWAWPDTPEATWNADPCS